MEKLIRPTKNWGRKIKLKKEFTTYLYLCNNLGKIRKIFYHDKIHTYQEWNRHVKDSLKEINYVDLEDLKHYFNYLKHTQMIADKMMFSFIFPIIVSIIASYFVNLAFDFPSKIEGMATIEILTIIIALGISIITLLICLINEIHIQIIKAEHKRTFYEDYVEIIEEVQKTSME